MPEPIIIRGSLSAQTPVTPQRQSRQLTELRNYIQQNQSSVPNALSRIISQPLQGENQCQFVFIGETHNSGHAMAESIAASFPRLQREAQARGETLILAVELDVSSQRAAANSPVNDLVRLIQNPQNEDFTSNGMWPVLFGARRAGVQVHCVDPGIPGLPHGQTPTTAQFDRRESILLDNITRLARPRSRIIYYGGLIHGSRTPIQSGNHTFNSAASRIMVSHGATSVVSLRNANSQTGFDGATARESSLPSVSSVLSQPQNNNGIMVVPVGRPITNNYGSHDHVIVVPEVNVENRR